MKLYYSKGACSLAIRIIINEIGLDCDYEAVDLKTKKTEKNKDFLAINPKGSVPALELDNKDLITENLVIQLYLIEQYKANKLCPPIGDMQRYKVLEWLNFISTDVHKSFGNLFNPTIPKEIQDQIFIPLIKTQLKKLDEQLAKHPFLAGDHFTISDAYLFVILLWTKKMNVGLHEFPHLERAFTELAKRPSIKKSLKEEGIELS